MRLKLLLLFILLQTIAFSQTSDQLWIYYYHYHSINDKITLYNDFSYRTTIDEHNWTKLTVRPSIDYNIKNWLHINGGLGFRYTFNPDHNFYEIRPFQGVLFKHKIIKWIKMSHYLRLEENFFFGDFQKFTLTFRYKLKTDFIISKHIYIPAYLEIFITDKNVIDIFNKKYRLGGGIGYKNDKIKIEAYYTNQGRNQNSTDNLYQIKIKQYF